MAAASTTTPKPRGVMSAILRRLWGGTLVLASLSLLLWPATETLRAIHDPAFGRAALPAQAWRWHAALSPAMEAWARARIGSTRAAGLALDDISGTEWPLFGALYYLRATESLDAGWSEDTGRPRPALAARGAIDAAADLLADPAQADWVVRHWGADWQTRGNLFYRMLVIDGLAAQAALLGDTPHRAMLEQQARTLAAELAASPTGLLEDYPAQTFPADVAAAWLAIRRADAVLGTRHGEAAEAGLRGFTGDLASPNGLPPYAFFGDPPLATEVRGCANAWLLHHAPWLWPDAARGWAALHARDHRVHGTWIVGYREHPHGVGGGFVFDDVDAGPVLFGLGTSASAFGIGSARTTGDHAMARGLALQAITASIPLPNGRLLVPRLLSDATDAPLLGESALLFTMTRPIAPGFEAAPAEAGWRGVPGIVWAVVLVQLLLGGWGLVRGLRRLRRA
jgi:hypothetical protein